MQRVQARVDIAKNRLYLTIGGKLTKKELDNLYTDVRFCVADLQPGFIVITDLSKCTIAALSGIPTFQKITKHLVANRLGLVIRIMNKNNLVVRQLLNFTARMGGYKAIPVSSMEEAEEAIEKRGQEYKLSFYLHNQLVSYKCNADKGNGIVSEMSTSGCSVVSATIIPSPEDQVSIRINFKSDEGLIEKFENNAQVISSNEDDGFTVRFSPLEPSQEEELWKRLVNDSARNLKHPLR